MGKGIKAAIISVVSVVTAAAILVGVLWYLGNRTGPVEVVPVANHVLGYYDNSVYYDGLVTADNIQSVYPSDTQTITEVFVEEGETVRSGDPLFSYDTTLSDIQLERKYNEMQQAELDLKRAEKELSVIKAMKPYTPPPPTQPPTEPPTEPLEPVEELPYFIGGEGTAELPYRWLWSEEVTYNQTFIEELFAEESTELWIMFEMREENALKGELLNCWGLHVVKIPLEELEEDQYELSYSFFIPTDIPDPYGERTVAPAKTPVETEWVDDSSGFTAAEIAKMRTEKEKEIRDLDVTFRIAKVEYAQMRAEVENGTVYSKIDGTVTRLIDAETALMEGTPMLTVSAGGCYNVEVAIGEYDLKTYPVGTEVTVTSWWNGIEITGTVEAISETPTKGYYYGIGNPNVSLYTATVAVPVDSGLREDEYVSVRFGADSTGSADTAAIYLEDMYIQTEDGRAYVYKRGEDGLLQKCWLRTGETMWGYTAIYGDITEEDWIAFPYGKAVKEGAKTVEAEESYYLNGDFGYLK